MVGAPSTEASSEVAFALPNPFRGSTRFAFTLPAAGTVDLRVYDMRGREVARPAAGAFTAGPHLVHFRGADLAAGTYFVHLAAQMQGRAPYERTGRVTLLR